MDGVTLAAPTTKLLRIVKEPAVHLPENTDQSSFDGKIEQEYTVNKLVDQLRIGKRTFYSVCCNGYTSTDDT